MSINGNNKNNTLHGTNGPDTINGKGGNDHILGNGGNDVIYGGSGKDNINGGSGDDKIYGGSGDDDLTGGGGKDRFYFLGTTGKVFIEDFKHGVDKLVISKSEFGFHTVQDVIDAAHPSGGDTPIDFSGTGADRPQIILLGFDLNPSVLAHDIILVA